MKRNAGLALVFSFMATAFGADMRPQSSRDDTAEILRETGLTLAQAQEVAGSKRLTINYNNNYEAGEAYSWPGRDSCYIEWSPYGEDLASGFGSQIMRDLSVRYDQKRVDQEIEKISLLHELAHCTQDLRSGSGAADEYGADEKALSWYLSHGGDTNSVKYWVFWRTLSPLTDGNNLQYKYWGIGPALNARFLGGKKIELGPAAQAYTKALAAMKDYNSGMEKQSWFVNRRKVGKDLIETMLADKSLKLEPDVRQVLIVCDEAYKFMANKSSQPLVAPRFHRKPSP